MSEMQRRLGLGGAAAAGTGVLTIGLASCPVVQRSRDLAAPRALTNAASADRLRRRVR